MQSRLFGALLEDLESDSAKTFVRHLNELLSLDEDTRRNCAKAVMELLKPTTDFQRRQLVDRLTGSRKENRRSVEHALAILRFFVDNGILSESIPEDDFKGWTDDLATVVNEDDLPTLQSVVQSIVEMRPELQKQDREKRAASGVLPKFRSFGATVEMRGIINDRYRWGTDVHQYDPRIVGHTYVASVHIGVDEGFPEGFN